MQETTTHKMKIAQGEFVLSRLPFRPRELLQAFDAADEYLLDTVAESIGFCLKNPPCPPFSKGGAEISVSPVISNTAMQNPRLLILNDSFGALAVALSAYKPTALSDSYLSQQATRLNLVANGLAESSVELKNSLDTLTGVFDVLLIKVPKTLALLEDQLIRLHPYLRADTQVIVAGMVKSLPPSVWKLLERLLGPTRTSLARKKARLIFVTPDRQLIIPPNPYPVYYTLENSGYLIANHANVFSRDSLDIGTRFFLQHLPSRPDAADMIDLGCGNGLVGLMASERNPEACIHFVDESFMAVASARENFERAFGQQHRATFSVGDGLMEFEPESADLILCNPPFHQQNTIGDQIAVSLFKQSKRVLRKGGELWIIGNRHLNYQVQLKRLFGHCSSVAANTKFVILKTRKQDTSI